MPKGHYQFATMPLNMGLIPPIFFEKIEEKTVELVGDGIL